MVSRGEAPVKQFKQLYERICRVEEFLAGACLVVSVFVVMASAVGRGVGYPLGWGMDTATFLFAWTVFFSADVALRKDRHVRLDIIIDRCPKVVQFMLNLFNYLVIAVFLGLLIRYGITMSYMTRFRAFQGIPGFSYMWATISVPIGCALLLITTILKINRLITEYRSNRVDNLLHSEVSHPKN